MALFDCHSWQWAHFDHHGEELFEKVVYFILELELLDNVCKI
jgi:hypothetical protein